MPTDQEQEQKKQRDIQELHTIRTELHYRLADLAEDNPNIIVGTVHQEFREVVQDHLHERVIETHHEFKAAGNYHHILWSRDKERSDGTFSTKYRLVKQPPHLQALRLELAAWRASSHLGVGANQQRQMMEDRTATPDVDMGFGVANSDGSFMLTAKALMDLLMASNAPAAISVTVSNPTYPSPPVPHVGGVNRLGAWTGLGALDEGQDLRSPNCMRAFQADPLKEHQALKPVAEACVEGITEDNMQLCLSNEPNADRICLCIRNIQEHFQDLGMEPICNIHLKGGDTINMLQEPGLLTDDIVDTWIDDLTIVRVWDPIKKVRLPVCDYDLKNMTMLGKALLNSCSEGLQMLIKAGLKPKDMSGPKIFFTILQKVYSPSISKMNRLKAQLRSMDLRTFAGENVTLFVGEAMPLVREIKMNSMVRKQFLELTIDSLQGLRKGSDGFLAIKVNDFLIANNNNRGNRLLIEYD